MYNEVEQNVQIIAEKSDEVKNCISIQHKVYSHRAFNYIVGHYKF